MRCMVLMALGAAALPLGAARAADWTMDPARSHLGFTATQLGAAFNGSFSRFQAAITFDPQQPASGHVVVLVDLASVRTGDTQRDLALPQSDWFDTAKTPQARYEAAGFTAKGGGAFEAPGTLTLRGVGHPLTLRFTLTLTGATAHASGTASITRTDWGVGQGQWSSGEMVGLPVAIDFDITAARS